MNPEAVPAIIGGGLVGMLTALALAKMIKTPVTVFEARPLPEPQNLINMPTSKVDGRSIALSNHSIQFLQQLEIWPILTKQCAFIKKVCISEQRRWTQCHLKGSNPEQLLGSVVDFDVLYHILYHKVTENDLVNVVTGIEVTKLAPISGGYQLTLQQKIQSESPHYKQYVYDTPLLLLANGMQSQQRAGLGIKVKQASYDQSALVANVSFSEPQPETAFERIGSAFGSFALLPRADQQYALIWMLSNKLAQQLVTVNPGPTLNQNHFKLKLTEYFGSRMGDITSISAIKSFPLFWSLAQEQVRPHLVLLGNAAHTLHPFAAQGFNLAIADILILTKLLVAGQTAGKSFGCWSSLRSYEQQRRLEQLQIMRGVHGLVKAVHSRSFWMSIGRQLGLLSLSLMPSWQHFFLNQASGNLE